MPMRDVVIYTTMFCSYCQRAKTLLAQKEISFTEIPVDGDKAKRDSMQLRAGGRSTVPQIFIGDLHVGGCDDLFTLDRAGKLDALLLASAD